MVYRRKYRTKKQSKSKLVKYSVKKGFGYGSRVVRYRNTVASGLGFPKKMIMTHRYAGVVSFSATAGAPTQYVWSANGMFDPDISGTGHQPYYFDQMTALYDHYVVIGSRIKIRVVPQGSSTAGTSNIPMLITLFVNDNTSATGTNPAQQAEYQSGKTVLTANSFDRAYTFTRKWSAKKTFGGSILANTELQGTSSTNPSEQSYYNLSVVSADGSSTVAVLAYAVIEYIAVWKEVIDVAQS